MACVEGREPAEGLQASGGPAALMSRRTGGPQCPSDAPEFPSGTHTHRRKGCTRAASPRAGARCAGLGEVRGWHAEHWALRTLTAPRHLTHKA